MQEAIENFEWQDEQGKPQGILDSLFTGITPTQCMARRNPLPPVTANKRMAYAMVRVSVDFVTLCRLPC